MEKKNMWWEFLKGLLKVALRIFITLLYGVLKLLETLLQHINEWLHTLLTTKN